MSPGLLQEWKLLCKTTEELRDGLAYALFQQSLGQLLPIVTNRR